MKLNIEGLCFGCMHVLEEDGHCSYCDFKLEEYEPSPHCLRPGERMNRYVIGRVIGEGSFGITYIGRDTLLERVVAIKEYFPHHYVSRDIKNHNQNDVYIYQKKLDAPYQKELEKFYDEAKKLSKFNDVGGIVSVMDFFYANETAYLVMGYVEGITLKERIKKHGAMSGESVLRLMKPMIEALMSVHQEGIIHRDISPDNIIVNKQGKLVLIDFGAARQESLAQTHSMTVMFKRGYTPEEQYRGQGVQGSWTDVYALCATMYFMLTGISPNEAIDRMLEDTLASLCDMPGVELEDWQKEAIMQGMAVKAEERIRDMSSLLDRLYGREITPILRRKILWRHLFAKRLLGQEKLGFSGMQWQRNAGKIAVVILLLCGVFFVWNAPSLISRGSIGTVTSIPMEDQVKGMDVTPATAPSPQKSIYRMVDLTGISKKDAEWRIARLGDAHLKVRWKWNYSSSAARGKIMKQSIAEGTEWEEGNERTQVLTISQGIRKYKVPNVAGMDARDAVRRLKKKKFQAKIVYSESGRPKGTVLKQGRKAGAREEKGTEILLTVSDGSGIRRTKPTKEPLPAKKPASKKQPSGDDFVARIPK